MQMESSSVEAGGNNAVENFLQAMRTSKVFEDRIELINQLGISSPIIISNLHQVVEGLVAFWEESSCSGVSHCKFNISILHVAQRHLQYTDTCDIFSQYVILSTKASKWCRIHFHSFFTTKDSNEESHMTTFIQLLLGSLNFASATSLALAKCSYLFKDQFLLVVEDFISEQLNLIKDSISDIKKTHSESEILKAGQELLGAAIRLSSIYCRSINSNSDLIPTYQKDDVSVNDGRKEVMPHIINIASCTIENLYELGILAATGGGNLVSILNISWKGVVSLLQLEVGKEIMASKVNISNIILTLISLATDSLKLSAESWIMQSPDGNSNLHSVTDTEARRSCIPIKFYLINAVRISSSYPCQAFRVYDDIISCVLKISALRFVLSNQEHLKVASEALAEILEPTSFIFLRLLLSSVEAGLEFKLEVLDRLFPNINSASSEESADDIHGEETMIDGLFSSKRDSRILLYGQLAVFFTLLQNQSDLGAEVVLGISKKLDWLLDAMAQEDIYVSTLHAQFPNISRSDSATNFTWQFMFPSILHVLKMFFIVVAPSTAWIEVESFLFRNIIHPHALCWELVLELWCFMVRHAQLDLVEQNINILCSLLKTLVPSNSISCSDKSSRKLARSLCTILKHVPHSIVELVYRNLLTGSDVISKSSAITAILLQEGFPMHLLSENSKKQVVMKITSAFSEFVMKLGEKLGGLNSRRSPSVSSALPKDPIYLLSLILSQCHEDHLQIEDECIHKVPKLAVALMKACSLAKESSQRHYYSDLLSHALEAISYVSHRLRSTDIREVLTTLDGLVTTGDSTLDEALVQFKPALALFLASLSAVEIPEDEGNAVSKAVWQLYHLILRERHWAGVYLGLASFGHFAARTSCNELWRFVPLDAALSFDIESGKKSDVEQFMSELKSFLVKEGALTSLSATKEEKNLLRREGLLQNEVLRSYLQMSEKFSVRPKHNEKDCESQEMEIDSNENGRRKLKYSDGIKEGMSLLQKGLLLITDNFAKWQGLNPEQQNQLADHLSCLANTIDQIASFGHS